MISIFFFYDRGFGFNGKMSFGSKFKHCQVLTYDGLEYVLTNLDRTGISSRVIKIKDIDKFIQRFPGIFKDCVAIVSTFTDKRHIKVNFPLRINSCNEVCKDVSGINLPFTFNVHHLFYLLKKLNLKRNYKIDYIWERSNG